MPSSVIRAYKDWLKNLVVGATGLGVGKVSTDEELKITDTPRVHIYFERMTVAKNTNVSRRAEYVFVIRVFHLARSITNTASVFAVVQDLAEQIIYELSRNLVPGVIAGDLVTNFNWRIVYRDEGGGVMVVSEIEVPIESNAIGKY